MFNCFDEQGYNDFIQESHKLANTLLILATGFSKPSPEESARVHSRYLFELTRYFRNNIDTIQDLVKALKYDYISFDDVTDEDIKGLSEDIKFFKELIGDFPGDNSSTA